MDNPVTGMSTIQFACGLRRRSGQERQWRQRMAGTRTNALVAGGAAAFVMCGLLLSSDSSALGRIVSNVVGS
jgi:putative Mg2+ transporter-C (MgtC) family protein